MSIIIEKVYLNILTFPNYVPEIKKLSLCISTKETLKNINIEAHENSIVFYQVRI